MCWERNQYFNRIPNHNQVTKSPASTPVQTTESTITQAPLTYPNPEEVIKYVADKKHVSSNEVKIVDFTRISRGSSMSPPNRHVI